VAAAGGRAVTSPWWSVMFYPGWVQHTTVPGALDWGAISHVAHFGRYANPDGTVAVGDMQTEANHGPLVTAAHAAGRKALLVIGGEWGGPGFVGACQPANRPRFVAALVALVRRYGYDGLDVDWEEHVPANEALFVALHHELRAALGPQLLLTTDVVSGLAPGRIAVQVAGQVDALHMMSYWTDGRDELAHYRAAGIPAAKLTVGAGLSADPTFADHTAAAVAGKTDLARGQGLRGVMCWQVGDLRPTVRADPRLTPLRRLMMTELEPDTDPHARADGCQATAAASDDEYFAALRGVRLTDASTGEPVDHAEGVQDLRGPA
jgi:hypothetical protein